ncbi:MAG: hypothetical protein QM396_01480 [Euryarchaeota archaeon]|jgi:hypothetical protein|nr:hypothetical protein [Methanobacterium sp.]MDI9434657.1 hypothetical protein [Euryarchaeota archaeon]HHT18399.1 hypothetical protein [Methanobacterium sp.]
MKQYCKYERNLEYQTPYLFTHYNKYKGVTVDAYHRDLRVQNDRMKLVQ